jgi:hypothetical protein
MPSTTTNHSHGANLSALLIGLSSSCAKKQTLLGAGVSRNAPRPESDAARSEHVNPSRQGALFKIKGGRKEFLVGVGDGGWTFARRWCKL